MENDRDILLIAIFTFLTVTLWIFFELVKTSKSQTIPPTVMQLVQPIQTTFDTQTLDQLNQKKLYR